MRILKILLVLIPVYLANEPPVQTGGCYGQAVPICPIGKKPICICTGPIGEQCGYICQ